MIYFAWGGTRKCHWEAWFEMSFEQRVGLFQVQEGRICGLSKEHELSKHRGQARCVASSGSSGGGVLGTQGCGQE